MIDTHTHTKYSFDGRSSAVDMAERGKALGLKYMAFTDHCDLDYNHIWRYMLVRQLKIDKYIEGVTALKERYPFLALGIECGYSELAEEDYIKKVPTDKLDYILNSIHTVDGLDCYVGSYFSKKTAEEAFTKYLMKVLKSTNAKYFYNTISHIGFVRKNAPYADCSMSLTTYGDILDEIFKSIIAKDKSLEINSNIKYRDFMPTEELVTRYFELGGRSVTFASDAHLTSRVGELYDEATEMIQRIGFDHWTVYRDRQPIEIPFK